MRENTCAHMSNYLIVIKFVAKHKQRNLKLAVLSFVKIVSVTSMSLLKSWLAVVDKANVAPWPLSLISLLPCSPHSQLLGPALLTVTLAVKDKPQSRHKPSFPAQEPLASSLLTEKDPQELDLRPHRSEEGMF